jgi:hypothetical protein
MRAKYQRGRQGQTWSEDGRSSSAGQLRQRQLLESSGSAVARLVLSTSETTRPARAGQAEQPAQPNTTRAVWRAPLADVQVRVTGWRRCTSARAGLDLHGCRCAWRGMDARAIGDGGGCVYHACCFRVAAAMEKRNQRASKAYRRGHAILYHTIFSTMPRTGRRLASDANRQFQRRRPHSETWSGSRTPIEHVAAVGPAFPSLYDHDSDTSSRSSTCPCPV